MEKQGLQNRRFARHIGPVKRIGATSEFEVQWNVLFSLMSVQNRQDGLGQMASPMERRQTQSVVLFDPNEGIVQGSAFSLP
jgi:hypothetical protein